MKETAAFTDFEQIEWSSWTPRDRATLLFVIEEQRILLIHKKRGLGAGKINAPGGRIQPGETALEAARREVEEELRIVPTDIRPHGELSFQFVDGYSIHVHVFAAHGYRGNPEETDEAVPRWTPVDDIPWERMWEDDRLWVPLLLRGSQFRGCFLFDDDAMLGHTLEHW